MAGNYVGSVREMHTVQFCLEMEGKGWNRRSYCTSDSGHLSEETTNWRKAVKWLSSLLLWCKGRRFVNVNFCVITEYKQIVVNDKLGCHAHSHYNMGAANTGWGIIQWGRGGDGDRTSWNGVGMRTDSVSNCSVLIVYSKRQPEKSKV